MLPEKPFEDVDRLGGLGRRGFVGDGELVVEERGRHGSGLLAVDALVGRFEVYALFEIIATPRASEVGGIVESQACNPLAHGGAPMAASNNRHVVPNPTGGWDVKAPGAKRASAHAATQAEAERRAKEIVANQGGGEVRIHGKDGRIRDSDTVAPGRDPNPPSDSRH